MPSRAQGRRWLRVMAWAVVGVMSALLLVLLAVTAVLTVRPLGRYVLGRVLTGPVSRAIHGRVSFQTIEGSIATGPGIVGLRVCAGSDSLVIQRLTFSYDPVRSLLARTFVLTDCRVTGPAAYVYPRPTARTARAREAARPRLPFPFRVERFELSSGRLYLDTVARLDSLDVSFSADAREQQVELRVAELRGRLCRESVSVRNVSGQARLSPDSLVVTDFTAMTANSRLRAQARLMFGPATVSVELEDLNLSLPEFSSFPGRVWLKGRLAGTGIGKPGQNALGRADYSAEGLTWNELHLPVLTGNVELKDSVLRARVAGMDSVLGSADVSGRVDLRHLDFDVSADIAGVTLRRLDRAWPDLGVDASVNVRGRGMDSVSADLNAEIPDCGVERLVASGTYIAKRRELRVASIEVAGAIGSASGSAYWTPQAVSASVEVESIELGRLERLVRLPLTGRVSGKLDCRGSLESLAVVGGVVLDRPGMKSVKAEQVSLDLDCVLGRELAGRFEVAGRAIVPAGQADTARRGVAALTCVDSLHLTWEERGFGLAAWADKMQLQADGDAVLRRDGVKVAVGNLRAGTALEALSFERPLVFSLARDSMRLEVSTLDLLGAKVVGLFEVVKGKLTCAEGSVSGLDLARLRSLLGLGFAVSGQVSLQVAGCDTVSVRLTGERVSIPAADVELSAIDFKASIRESTAMLEHLWLVRTDSSAAPETTTVAGSIGYRTRPRFELGAADFRARLRNPGAWVVAYLKPFLELRSGAVFGELRLSGRLDEPRLGGRARISRARLGAPVVGVAFDRVNAELVFDRNRILIEKLSGRSDHGTALVTGFVALGHAWQVDSLRFHGDFTSTTLNPRPEIYAIIGGSLDLAWAKGSPFSLSGDVDVEEALLAFGFGQSAGAGGKDTTLVYDIRVKAERDVWLRNSMADIEFGGDLTVRKTTSDMFVSGELVSRQGAVYNLDHTLRVTTGAVRFENTATLNPNLDITAELPVRAGGDARELPDKIVLTLNGTLDKYGLELKTEPPMWDETAILTYLTLNVTPDQIPDMSREEVSKLLSERVLDYIQKAASKKMLGFVPVDVLEFESGLLSGRDTRVTVGKYVGRNFYVSYTQSFTGDIQPQVKVEYYISRRNEIVAELGEKGRTSLRYRFKLRY